MSSRRVPVIAGLVLLSVVAGGLTATAATAAPINGKCPSDYVHVKDYGLHDKAGKKGPGSVEVYFNDKSDRYCAITRREKTAKGVKGSTFVSITTTSNKTAKDSGRFSYYAGPVTIAAQKCVTVKGSLAYKGSTYKFSGKLFCSGPPNVKPKPVWVLPRNNPRSVAQAVAWAKGQARNQTYGSYYRLCGKFVANAYGWRGMGYNYAIDMYDNMPRALKHPGDRNYPVGAVLFWRTNSRAGHVAIYVGNGMIASNDIVRNGDIAIVPMRDIERKWGARYAGWTAPYFRNGWTRID